MSTPVRDDELHAWLDGQLPAQRRAEVEDWLRAHPRDAERVEGWRRDAAALRTALAGQPLPEAPGLAPHAIRRRVAAERETRQPLICGSGVSREADAAQALNNHVI